MIKRLLFWFISIGLLLLLTGIVFPVIVSSDSMPLSLIILILFTIAFNVILLIGYLFNRWFDDKATHGRSRKKNPAEIKR